MVEKLRGSFYVDNCLTGVKDPCDQASFIERTQTLMSRGGFNLRGWDTWKLKVSWDIELPPDVSKKFFKWVNELYLLKEVCLSRFMPFSEGSELHVFVDASQVAYSACVFVRTVLEAETSVSLIRAKTRVAPLKPLAIPRLELMACCIGARLVNSIRDALNLPNIKVTFWSDSEVALWWIKEHGDWSVFVTNRVQEIRQLTQL
ncbi:hypothetical protein AVEN_155422-1 [Araneus ventricosus]|uniref:Uncharacterized protein n=1 Tax=Araneus ventricosus TaxID=182803 RepID=A0A4Y2MMM3_ARAVE|nr:hypothetical protein AVEN_155422-1 [Araneus ventricosus]